MSDGDVLAGNPRETGKKRRGAGCLRWIGRVALGGLILLLALIASGAIYQGIASARDSKAYKPMDQMVDVDGIQMRLDCRGSGSPTVVLEAGAQSFGTYWVRVQDEVAQFTRVCSYDRAGYGWSDSVHEAMSPQRVAEMLHTLLENGREAPPYLMVGHSFGGIYIRAFTEDYPNEVVGMVLVDSTHEDQAQEVPAEIKKLPEFEQFTKAAMAVLRIFPIAESIGLVRAFKLQDAGIGLIFTEEEKGPVLAQVYRSGYFWSYAREADMMTAYSGRPGGKLGDMPLIVLSQKWDAQKVFELYPPTIQSQVPMEVMQQQADFLTNLQEELAALSTRSKHIIVENSGHFIQLDAPHVVIDAIREVYGEVTR